MAYIDPAERSAGEAKSNAAHPKVVYSVNPFPSKVAEQRSAPIGRKVVALTALILAVTVPGNPCRAISSFNLRMWWLLETVKV
jgi:hypothetical protein